MNNTQQTILDNDQRLLVAEITSGYGVAPEEIIFFSNEPRPLFTYEATCVLCNRLTDLRGIDVEPINNGFVDSISYRCTLTQEDGSTRSAVGVANVDEKDASNKPLKSSQLVELASGRAIRNALRVAGIDLLKLHARTKNEAQTYAAVPRSNYEVLLRRVHALGVESGMILGNDKSAYRAIMHNRYDKIHSNELTEDQLADFAAVLKTLTPRTGQIAA